MDERSAWPPHSIDAFHRGAFHLAQPLDRGHRAGTDAMMLAAAVPSGFSGTVADLGAGAGAAGLAVLARCQRARAVLVERSPDMAQWARRSLELTGNETLRARASVLEADVTLRGNARRTAGLGDRGFDFAIMNPPFNHAPDRASPDPLRREAHVMEPGLFDAWLRTASAILTPRGGVAVIARPQSLPEILAALAGRFGAAEILPVLPRADSDAIRIVVRAIRSSRAALSLKPPLVVHHAAGNGFSPRAEGVTNGLASLFGD